MQQPVLAKYELEKKSQPSIHLHSFFLYLVVSLIILLLCFASSIWIENAHHDNTRYFRESKSLEFKAICDNDSQFGWLVIIGRPLAAKLECLVFQNVQTLTDLGELRIGVIFLLAIATSLLAILLLKNGLDRFSAGLLALAVFVLPGAQNTVLMTNFPNAITPLLAIGAYLFFNPMTSDENLKISTTSKFLISIGLLVLGMLIYPALVFVYFWGSFIAVLSGLNNKKLKQIKIILCDLLIFLSASVVYLMLRELFSGQLSVELNNAIPNSYKSDLSLESLITKLPIIFTELLPQAASLWFVDNDFVCSVVLTVLSFSAFTIMFDLGVNRVPQSTAFSLVGINPIKLIAFFILLISTFAPLLLTKQLMVLQRLLFPAMGAIVIIFVYAIPQVVQCIFCKYRNMKPNIQFAMASFMSLVGLVSASHANTMNIWNTNIEMEFIRQSLFRHQGSLRRIHFVKAVENSLGFNGLPAYVDEFNRKTSDYDQDIVNLVRVALVGSISDRDIKLVICDKNPVGCERTVPQDFIYLSISEYAENFCATKDMAIVDMNVLIQSTHTGSPKLVDSQKLSRCQVPQSAT